MAPACTLCQNRCEVPFGTTAMTFFFDPWQEVSRRQTRGRMAARRSITFVVYRSRSGLLLKKHYCSDNHAAEVAYHVLKCVGQAILTAAAFSGGFRNYRCDLKEPPKRRLQAKLPAPRGQAAERQAVTALRIVIS